MIDWVHASVTVIESVTYFFRRKLSPGLFVTIQFNGIQYTDTEFIHFHPIICTVGSAGCFKCDNLNSNSSAFNKAGT